MIDYAEAYDHEYWGPDGPRPAARWGVECARGISYRQTGAPVRDGTPGARRQLGGMRKARGMASEGVKNDHI